MIMHPMLKDKVVVVKVVEEIKANARPPRPVIPVAERSGTIRRGRWA
jgi:hypothetical protein